MRKALIMAEPAEKSASSTGKLPKLSSLSTIVLIVLLVLVAIGVGIGITSSSASTQYACLSISHQGNNVDITTNGIFHISGSQNYVACPEGTTAPTSPTTVSCVTITPQVHDFPYPDASPYIWYYITATGHAITVPGAAANSTELIPPPDIMIQVSC
jgi:hypothetical protein